ncbi:hypothetical protein [Gandjariella thermophila]|uniref:DAGKc domain-containing protein n=1 Tax=Gandjariella thermophila TaxID=1931992 RepID=A0A4D4JCL4_9PSEU|nr:hypothetical protein [Gandjariella thermophila]GDY32109.1 hypothetical protein GTS_37420 [Gandjariella thermophila]
MNVVALACGNDAANGEWRAVAQRDDVEWHEVPARPGKPHVDPLLGELGGRRLVVFGTDADLAAVVLRLLRTERLGEVPVGYVPRSADSAVAELWGLPTDPRRALDLAVAGDPDPVPLVRDDSGGVLLGSGTLGPVRGVAYCDNERILRGQASRIEVSPDPRGRGVAVRVRHGLLLRRTRTATGRAFEIGCLPTRAVSDGVAHPRPVNRWTWYRHTEDLRLVRGLV